MSEINGKDSQIISDEDFIRRKMNGLKFLIGLGLILIIVSNLGLFLFPNLASLEFWPNFLNIMGFVILSMGIVRLYLIKKSPERVKQNKIAEYDERNVDIRGKAAYMTYIVSIISLVVADVFFVYLDYWIPVNVISVIIAIEFVSFIIFLKYYGDKL